MLTKTGEVGIPSSEYGHEKNRDPRERFDWK